MPPTLSYPRGNPLTESMPFTDGDGVCWLAYIEGVPPASSPRLWSRTLLPGRHLRFDCATESRVTTSVPAGSPFLADARLQSLLDQAQPAAAPAIRSSSGEASILEHRVVQWATRAGELCRAAVADWSRSDALHVVAVAVLGLRRARR